MAPKLKDYFDRAVVVALARELRSTDEAFDERAFVRESLKGLEALELTQRGWRSMGWAISKPRCRHNTS